MKFSQFALLTSAIASASPLITTVVDPITSDPLTSTSSVSTRTPASWNTSHPLTSSTTSTTSLLPTTTPKPSSSSFSFTPIQPSTVPTGPTCLVVPAGPADPFVAFPGVLQTAGLHLTYYSGVAGLGSAFSNSWTFGANNAIGAWYPHPCGYVYLNILESGYSWKHLTFDGSSNTNWNATLNEALASVSWKSQPLLSANFIACYTVAQAVSDIAGPIKWFLFLQTGTDVPTENAFGQAIFQPSCVRTEIITRISASNPIPITSV